MADTEFHKKVSALRACCLWLSVMPSLFRGSWRNFKVGGEGGRDMWTDSGGWMSM